MKTLPLILRLVPGMLALWVFSPVLRAEEGAPEKLSSAKEKEDTDKDGQLGEEDKAAAKADGGAKAKAREAEKLKQVLKEYDANHNGQLDEPEKAKMKADEAARAEKFKQALAKYDANHDGKLDATEEAKMLEDEELAAKTARQAEQADAKFQRKLQRLQGKDVPRATKVPKR
jgi:hypothetical protein